MSSIASGQIFKVSIGLIILSTVLMMVMKTLRKLFTKNKKRAILYAIFVLLTFAITGLLSYHKLLNDSPANSFIGFQFLFIGLGSLHVYIMRKFFPDLSKESSSFWSEFVFTLIYVALGLLAFLQVVSRFKAPFSMVFMGSSILFVVPFLFYKLYEFAYLIPVPVYKSWIYPLGQEIKDPTKDELANPRVISFEFKKTSSHNEITNFRVKAPQAMEFGRLFYFFIVDYNERHPESPIEIMNEETKQPSEWVFHFKQHWYSPLKHLNESHTVAANNLKENSVIICSRVSED